MDNSRDNNSEVFKPASEISSNRFRPSPLQLTNKRASQAPIKGTNRFSDLGDNGNGHVRQSSQFYQSMRVSENPNQVSAQNDIQSHQITSTDRHSTTQAPLLHSRTPNVPGESSGHGLISKDHHSRQGADDDHPFKSPLQRKGTVKNKQSFSKLHFMQIEKQGRGREMRKSILVRKPTISQSPLTPQNLAFHVFAPDKDIKIKEEMESKDNQSSERSHATEMPKEESQANIVDSHFKAAAAKPVQPTNTVGQGSPSLNDPQPSYFEKYYSKLREPKKEPVKIPGVEDLVKLRNKNRVKRLFEQQRILYGQDVLDTDLDRQEEEILARDRRDLERKKEEHKNKQEELLKSIFHKDGKELTIIQATSPNGGHYNIFSKLVISMDSTWKSVFDVVMLISSCYNTFSQAYYAAFGNPTNSYQNFLDYFIEILFFMDFIFCFCQEYKDEETYTIVSDIKKIAKHYLKGSCIFDLLANIPFELLFASAEAKAELDGGRLFRLFKLLRVPRLFALLNVDRIKQIITDYYNRRLQKAVQANVEGEPYPILKSLMLVQVYKIFRLVVIIFTSSYFLGIVWHIYVVDFQTTIWINPDNKWEEGPVEQNFRTQMLETDNPDNEDGDGDKLIKVWYYAITTLSTIGFGDFSPVSVQERFITSFILLFGVAVFSFIMGQFIEILMNYKKLWEVGRHRDLSKWIALLSRFNNGNPLNKELITKIEDFFNFYWQNNRLSALNSEADIRFMDELPYYVQGEIFIDYLFNDFLYMYRWYFSPQQKKRLDRAHAIALTKQQNMDFKMKKFLVEFVRKLEPRFYKSELIQDQYEEIFEVVFITKGSVGIGYRLFSEIFYGQQIVMSKKKKSAIVINDYSCLYNKCSEFLYQPIDTVEALAMRKENYNEVMLGTSQGKRLKLQIAKSYKFKIQEKMHEHRNDMAKRFQNRIDYVDIKAYGVGKVDVDAAEYRGSQMGDTDREFLLSSNSIDEEFQFNVSPTEQQLFKHISNFDKGIEQIELGLAALSDRHDERLKMVMGLTEPDEYQPNLMKKVYFDTMKTGEKTSSPQKKMSFKRSRRNLIDCLPVENRMGGVTVGALRVEKNKSESN